METRARADSLGLSNLEVHSFHSFCRKRCTNKKKYKILILDETQDMCPLYYELICKIQQDLIGFNTILVLGDPYQGIYDFNQADPRFITMADLLFNFNNKRWIKLSLSKSYRVTQEIADFVNKCSYKDERIVATKKGTSKVQYIIGDTFNSLFAVDQIVKFHNKGYSYEDIFILAPSVKRQYLRLQSFIKSNGGDYKKIDYGKF